VNKKIVISLSVVMASCAASPGPGDEDTGSASDTAMLTGTVEIARHHGHARPLCPGTTPRVHRLSGCGTATLDGTLSRGEWRRRSSVRFDVNLPGGGTTRARMFVMNDATNLYVALRFARAAADPGNSFGLEWDVDHSCGLSNGDDAVVANPSVPTIFDDFRTDQPPCPAGSLCGLQDIDAGGTNDGGYAFANASGFNVYEISHPLDSGDTGRDFALHAGDSIGMTTFLRMIGTGGVFPDDFGDTTFPDAGFVDIRIRACGHRSAADEIDDQDDDGDLDAD
jgi:hypothetical protein